MKDTKEIRKQLKEQLGYNARQVSVKGGYGGYSSSLVFTIRDESVDYDKLEKFANQFESIDRCPVTLEILSGGNTYVNIYYSEKLIDKFENEYYNELNEKVKELKDNNEFKFKGFRFVFFKDNNMLEVFKITTEMISGSVARYSLFDVANAETWFVKRLSRFVYLNENNLKDA